MQTSVLVKRLLLVAGATAAAVLTFMLMARLVGPLPVSVTQTVTQKDSTFDVTGESELTTVPDQATAHVGVQINRATVAQAQTEANEIINAITEQVRELGVTEENIKTVNYSIRPEYSFEGQRQLTGYNVNANLQVKVEDFSRVNQVIDAATQAGANEVGNIQFELSAEKEAELVEQAREEAIADARENAQELARLAGMRLGKIVNVTEFQQDGPMPVAFDRMALEESQGAGGAPTQIEPGSTTFTYRVTLSYETL